MDSECEVTFQQWAGLNIAPEAFIMSAFVVIYRADRVVAAPLSSSSKSWILELPPESFVEASMRQKYIRSWDPVAVAAEP